MIKLLVKRFIPNYSNYSDPIVRKKYGVFCGVLGIICNLLLFVIKITVGAVTGSIAVVSDAFNNLSDLGSSAVSVVGARLSGKIADKEHPYGHGRGEYISSLIIGILIIFFGIELLKSSVSAIITPTITAGGQEPEATITEYPVLCLHAAFESDTIHFL